MWRGIFALVVVVVECSGTCSCSCSCSCPSTYLPASLKTQLFCETFSIFELHNLDNIKNEAVLRDFLQKWKIECRADGLVPMRCAIFPLHLSKVPRLPRKSDARSYEVLHPSRKIITAILKIWCSKIQPLSRNQRPGQNISDEHVSCTAPANENASFRIFFKCPTPAIVFGNATKSHVLLTFDTVHNPLRLPRETTSERPKVLRTTQFFALLASKCASRHNGVHFFDSSTSKSAPKLCFVHLDLEMCFAPQGRTLFRHLNFQKCSGPGVFCTFWLGNLLRATTACNFSSLVWPAGSAPAALASLLFDPPEPQIIGKTQCFAAFLLFRAPGSSFFWDFLFFPRASERRVFLLVGSVKHFHIFTSSHPHIFTSSHLNIFSSSHPHDFTSSHLLIFTSSHLHIFSSSQLHILTSSHLHIFSSSHLLIFTSHLHIFSSSHLHIFSSSHLLIFTSSHPHIFTSSHLHILSCPLALSFFYFFSISLLKARGSANETARNATFSHETRFDRPKLR